MFDFDTHASEIIQRTPNIKSFRFPTDGDPRYLPGQFFFITIRIRGEEAIHHFSFSSSPTEKGYIEFTKRITTSDFSQALAVMKPGDFAHLRGPEGAFTLPHKQHKLAFLSGGIGITPLRSMLRYVTDKKLDYDIVLLYGNNNWEDIAFREELDSIVAANRHVRVEYILSGPNLPPDWKGKTGFINKDIVVELVPDYKERLFYLSGPPRMVIGLEGQLTALNMKRDQIKEDSFTGYD